MQALPVIDAFDELANAPPRVGEIEILGAINFLVLQRLDERLGLGVVIRIAAPAHADANAMLSEQLDVITGSVLHSLI